MVVLLLFEQRLSEKLSCQKSDSASDLQILEISGAEAQQSTVLCQCWVRWEYPHLREMLRA